MPENYKDLIAWQKARAVTLDIYRCTRTFPREEVYGLASQMRRAAISIVSNIAEGKGRYSRKEFLQFLYRARGSQLELETQFGIAHDLHYVETPMFHNVRRNIQELGRVLNGLINRFHIDAERGS